MNAKTVKKKAAPRKKAAKKTTQLIYASDLPPDFEVEVPLETSLVPYENKTNLPRMNPVQMSPIEQMQQMKSMGVNVADMKGMLELQREYEKGEALKAFNVALAAFKAEDIKVYKRGKVGYENSDGTKTGYSHAKLEDIVEITVPFLSIHGFSHRWRTEQSDKGMTRVTFILTHSLGHSEETTLQAGIDQSGGKNNIQALGSTVSYLERYTFLAGTGIAVKDMDNDAKGADVVLDVISETQLADMRALIEEVGSNDSDFAAHCRLESLDKMPLSRYKSAIEALKAKGNIK